MELNLVWENVTKVAKFAFARSQSMTVEARTILSKGKQVLTIERGRLWIGRPTRVLRSWTTMPGVGVAYGNGGSL